MTYAELKSLVQNYLENTETTFVSDLPKIIEQAEVQDEEETEGTNVLSFRPK